MKRTIGGSLVALLLAAACGGGLGGGPPAKLTDGKLVIAVINDQSGVYADLSGKNAVEAVNMAVEDFKAKYGENALGGKVEVLTADHQNKADVAQQKAQEFYERSNADLILDVPTSSAALAIADVAKAQQKLYINVTAATTVLTGKSCNKYTFHYAYDTYMLAQGTGVTVTQQGGKSWYIIYPNYALGQDVLAGTVYTTPWLWNMDDQSKTFADKFLKRTGIRPTFAHAGNYSAAWQYMDAVRRAGSDDADAVVKRLEGYKFSDFFIRNGFVRPEDHWVQHDALIAQVKPKSEAKETFDYSKVVSTIAAEKASRPLSEAGCSMPK